MICEICGKEIEESSYMNAVLCSDECFSKHFWLEKINNQNDKNQVVINHRVYHIGEEDSTSAFRGFNGQKFVIEFFDGRVVTTTNLWFNGYVPDDFKDELPDNARWKEV